MPIEAVPLPTAAGRYIEVSDADDLAAALPGLAAYRLASDDQKAAALDEATADVDAAMPYHGCRLAAGQPREFPRRVDDPPGDRPTPAVDPTAVWDYDLLTGLPVVPRDVRRATLYQADAILSGTREPRLAAQHDGVVYELTGALAESYKATPGPGVPTGLCRRAWALMRKYRLRSGRLV